MPHLMGHLVAFLCQAFQASSSEAPDSVLPITWQHPILLVGAEAHSPGP